MGIEEHIKQLEETVKQLTEKVKFMETQYKDRWVSAKELAEIMGCSTNNVYIKIRTGEIYATKKLGAIPRIPMSQFYKEKSK